MAAGLAGCLMTDLFGNLGVAQSEFFLGQGRWSGIKQVSANSGS
jgi:hypothetical protein